MGITEILTIVFVVLKLLGKIQWSWVAVLLPEMIGIAMYIVVCVIHYCKIRSAAKLIEKTFKDF